MPSGGRRRPHISRHDACLFSYAPPCRCLKSIGVRRGTAVNNDFLGIFCACLFGSARHVGCLSPGVVPSRSSTLPPAVEPVTVRQSTEATTAIVIVPDSGVDLEAVERALIVFALDTTGGNRTRAARLLRLTRSALLYRLQKYGLTSRQSSS